MIFSKKLEAFMAVVEYGSLSKAAKVMNRTTPPVAKSIKDFEMKLGKRLFKREKFGMSLTQDGTELYNDLKDLYLQEKEITKKYINGSSGTIINIYYDWGKYQQLIKLHCMAKKINAQINILRFHYDSMDSIGDFEGNTLILSAEPLVSERFSLVKEITNGMLGVYCRRSLYQEAGSNLNLLLKRCMWLCEPVFCRSVFIRTLQNEHQLEQKKQKIHQIDNLYCCMNLLLENDYLCITEKQSFIPESAEALVFIPFEKNDAINRCYIYKSKSHASMLNRILGYLDKEVDTKMDKIMVEERK